MSYVSLAQSGKVSIITMGFEKRMNALESPFRDELKSTLKAVGSDPTCHVAVITGTGKAFCAGGSLNDFADGLEAGDAVEYMKNLNDIILTIKNMEKPIIAGVNGVAIGAGVSIALACDLVIASEEAVFSLPFSKVGLIPDLGSIYFLPRIVGLHKTKELIYTGDTLTAGRAFDMGLLNHVVAPDELISFSMEMATRIANGPPKAIALSKSLVSRSLQLSLEDVLVYEVLGQAVSFQSEDHKEGVKAFFEKRAPEFGGK